MKKFKIITAFFLLAAILQGCASANERETIKWIAEHKKPIRCIYVGSDTQGNTIWTLIDADGNIYNTGRVEMNFPDTLDVYTPNPDR